jgi:hypothetical protein
LIAVY